MSEIDNIFSYFLVLTTRNQKMNYKERQEALVQLGKILEPPGDYLKAVMHRTSFHNQWLTDENQEQALTAIAKEWLQPEVLSGWLNRYAELNTIVGKGKKIGLVSAGNIPVVGLHDVICVFAAGHQAVIKLSDKDPYLLPAIIKEWDKVSPGVSGYFEFVERLQGFDAVIATGSDNSARYFEYYFGKYPHVIRRNRNAVAVLDGQESYVDLLGLGRDVFQYFGLGCRNVSKLYLPKGYAFDQLHEAFFEYRELVLHPKYKNNYDYNYAMYILNKVPFIPSGPAMLLENPDIPSRIGTLHYEYYEDLTALQNQLQHQIDHIQCIVARPGLLSLPAVAPGKAQSPAIDEYADGVDTMSFLIHIT